MPNVLRLSSVFASRGKYWLFRRFANETLRFRLAVSTGFLIVAVGFLVLGADERFGVAQGIWGFLGLPDAGLERPVASGSEPQAIGHIARHRHHARTARRSRPEGRQASGASVQPVALARKSFCVRLCDGFAFPVGNYYGEGDRPAHEAACQSECPGARTALYVLPAGSDTLADATQVKTGQLYSKMPVAFRYTTYVDEACTCHPQGGGAAPSLLRDFTLRRGDAVMTPNGLQVFHGGAGFPFKRRDFVALSRSRDIRQADRSQLRAIERASLGSSTKLADLPRKTLAASRNATRGLAHQAQN